MSEKSEMIRKGQDERIAMSEKSEMIRRARALESLRNLADLRSRREWDKVFALTQSVVEANTAGRRAWYETMREVRAIAENYVVRI